MQKLLDLFPILREEFLQSTIGMVLNTTKYIVEIIIRIDLQSAAGLSQGIDDGSGFAASFASDKHPILSANDN